MVGFYNTSMVYFISGIFGNLFGSYVEKSDKSIGAYTAISGLLTGILAVIFVNWS